MDKDKLLQAQLSMRNAFKTPQDNENIGLLAKIKALASMIGNSDSPTDMQPASVQSQIVQQEQPLPTNPAPKIDPEKVKQLLQGMNRVK